MQLAQFTVATYITVLAQVMLILSFAARSMLCMRLCFVLKLMIVFSQMTFSSYCFPERSCIGFCSFCDNCYSLPVTLVCLVFVYYTRFHFPCRKYLEKFDHPVFFQSHPTDIDSELQTGNLPQFYPLNDKLYIVML